MREFTPSAEYLYSIAFDPAGHILAAGGDNGVGLWEVRKLIKQFNGREIKTIGDSFMAAFRSVPKALDYARALQSDPGDARIQVRAGIHIGPMQVEEDDVFGGAVNFAARVVGAIKGPEVWLSDRAKRDIDSYGAKQYRHLQWQEQRDVQMRGFIGTFTLWSLTQ